LEIEICPEEDPEYQIAIGVEESYYRADPAHLALDLDGDSTAKDENQVELGGSDNEKESAKKTCNTFACDKLISII